MSDVNRKPTVVYPVKEMIAPQSVAASATVTSGWIDAAMVDFLSVVSLVGAGAGTAALKIEQATSNAGANAKDAYTAAQTGITAQATGTKVTADLVLGALGLDVNGGFRWVRVSVTVTGGAGTLYGCGILGGPAKFQS